MHISRSSKNPLVLVTMGDPSGIGPEVVVRALSKKDPKTLLSSFAVVGDLFVLSRVMSDLKLKVKVNIVDLANVPRGGFSWGKDDPRYGKAALEYIDAALKMIKGGGAKALVTGPVNKSSVARSGIKFSGHTEYLAEMTGTKRFAMMLLGGALKVTLVTRHVALKDVPRLITGKAVSDAIELTHDALVKKFGIRSPRIGVAGLNPHAGDLGLFGKEEEGVIRPAVKKLSRRIKGLTGPRPPDTVFHEAYQNKYDAVVAMYHDQGLAPLKMLYLDEGVNLTLGLPFVRTSPDHGTAFDIAGRGKADPRSMTAAIDLALRLSGM